MMNPYARAPVKLRTYVSVFLSVLKDENYYYYFYFIFFGGGGEGGGRLGEG